MTVATTLAHVYQYAGEWYAIIRGDNYRIISSTMSTITVCPLPVR